ncbi:MAG: hypothetical protein V4671_11525 [Armatimonadota bacterium]
MTILDAKPESKATIEVQADPERERLQAEILERMIVSFRASQAQQPTQSYNPWFQQRVSVMTDMAKLFLGFPIPIWPPGLLLRKIVRRLVLPLFAPQVEFNTAARDVVLELRQRSEAQAAALQESIEQISRLEEHIEALTLKIEDLQHTAAASERAFRRS